MKRKILLVIFFSILLILTFSSCKHKHTGGTATCMKLAVCEECGEAYGEKAEHNYKGATCQAPEVCTLCRHVRGTAVDHDYSEATCTTSSVCRFCGDSGSNPLGHEWSEVQYNGSVHWYDCLRCGEQKDKRAHLGGTATCEQLARCSVCAVYYGVKGAHDFTSATCTEGEVCKVCGEAGAGENGHSWKNTISYDEDNHWYACWNCSEIKDCGPHTGGAPTETERAVCEVCHQHYGPMIEIKIDWETEAVYPKNGAVVTLANADICTWAQGYDYRYTNTDQYWLEKDFFAPNFPLFKWTVGSSALYYKFYISESYDMSGADCYLVSKTEASVDYLYVGTTYYWYVDAVYSGYTVRSEIFSFSTAKTPRTVNIEGVSNSRDIGGYITLDGNRIKQGLVYRSAKLDDITELGKYTLVNILGVKTDLDLRGNKATQPVSELNHIATACPWYSTGDNHIWLNETNKAEFAKTVKVFADPDNYPIIFHCSLGRDRTGTLAMVLLGLLGVDENTLMMEYELSVFSYWGAYGETKFNSSTNSLRNQIHNTYTYIDNNYDGDTFSEKVEDFLLEIGVTAEEIASIKNIMLEEAE